MQRLPSFVGTRRASSSVSGAEIAPRHETVQGRRGPQLPVLVLAAAVGEMGLRHTRSDATG